MEGTRVLVPCQMLLLSDCSECAHEAYAWLPSTTLLRASAMSACAGSCHAGSSEGLRDGRVRYTGLYTQAQVFHVAA